MIEQQYIDEILRTYAGADNPVSKLTPGALGLAGETGEVIGMIKKRLFQGHTLEEVMMCNIQRLRTRYPDGFAPERSINREDGGDR
jgi:hypothetical protein